MYKALTKTLGFKPPEVALPRVGARDISIDFLGAVGQSRSLEDYIKALEKHRWELEHRLNQLSDQISAARPSVPRPDEAPSDALVDPDRDRARNIAEASSHPEEVYRSEQVLEDYLARLAADAPVEAGRVPKIFHFVYGFKDAGDLPYYGYMAMRSALHFNPGWTLYLHCRREPIGPNWDRIKDHANVIPIADFTYFKKARLHHYAHKADVIRLLAIYTLGGVYLDMDTITKRSFDDLRDVSFCMGVQAAGSWSASGLCNAVLMGQPGAPFSRQWIEQYDYFRSQGRDDLWDYHSVKYPARLMALHPDWITVLDYRAFFFPLWTDIERQIFTDAGRLKFKNHFHSAYCFHLWHGETAALLDTIDEGFVRTSTSIYAEIAGEVEGFRS